MATLKLIQVTVSDVQPNGNAVYSYKYREVSDPLVTHVFDVDYVPAEDIIVALVDQLDTAGHVDPTL